MLMKLLFTVFILWGYIITKGQETTLSARDKASLDSLLATDEFFKLMKEGRAAKSFVQVSAGIGNSYFSVKIIS